MAVALPGGWVDTGITKSVATSCSIRVQMPWGNATVDEYSLNGNGTYGGPISCAPPTPVAVTLYVDLHSPYHSPTTLENNYYCINGPFPNQISSSYSFSKSIGPYRLGVRYRLIDPSTTDVPLFAQVHYLIEYAWFIDENTVYSSSCASHSSGNRYFDPGTGNWTPTQCREA
jgi:hypothetical protein